MRITNGMLVNNMMNYISNNLTRMDKYQMQLATGKKIAVPSDDPIVAARALKLRTDVSEIDQYQRNVKDAQSWMELTESSLSNVGDLLQRVRELAVEGASSTLTTDDCMKISKEVEQLKDQLIHLGNVTYAGRYIFSGFKTDTTLLNDDGTFAIDVDNTERITFEIGIGDDMNINVPGGDLFNSGGNATATQKGKLIQDFDDIISALNAGDNNKVSSMLNDLDDDLANVNRIRSDVGARMNRLELTSNRLDSDGTNFTRIMSENEDVDMSETIMNLKNEENVYRASLSGGARIIQPSLVDFLR